MFDIGGTELILIAVLALIVIGPKDLPGAMRAVGRVVAKMRAMAHECRSAFDDAAREIESDETKPKK